MIQHPAGGPSPAPRPAGGQGPMPGAGEDNEAPDGEREDPQEVDRRVVVLHPSRLWLRARAS